MSDEDRQAVSAMIRQEFDRLFGGQVWYVAARQREAEAERLRREEEYREDLRRSGEALARIGDGIAAEKARLAAVVPRPPDPWAGVSMQSSGGWRLYASGAWRTSNGEIGLDRPPPDDPNERLRLQVKWAEARLKEVRADLDGWQMAAAGGDSTRAQVRPLRYPSVVWRDEKDSNRSLPRQRIVEQLEVIEREVSERLAALRGDCDPGTSDAAAERLRHVEEFIAGAACRRISDPVVVPVAASPG